MAFWMGKCFPQLRVYSNNNKLFIDACNSNDIDVAQLVVSIRPHCYYLCVIDITRSYTMTFVVFYKYVVRAILSRKLATFATKIHRTW